MQRRILTSLAGYGVMTFGFIPRALTMFLLFYLAARLKEHVESGDRSAGRLDEGRIASLAIVILSLMAASTAVIYFMNRPLPERPLPTEDVSILDYPLRSRTVQYPLHLNLDGQIELLGYDLNANQIRPEDTLELTLYWHTLTELGEDYTVFTHLLGESYNLASGSFLWGQKDSMPLDGSYPTSRWLENEVVVDSYAIAVQPDAPPGLYRIEVGMYLLETGQRIPVFDEQGQRMSDDRVMLEETIEVVPAK